MTAPRVGMAFALLLCACTRAVPTGARAPVDHPVASNILRSDLVGSPACATCHAEVFAAWAGSPMHRMTRDGAVAEIRAPAEGAPFQFKGESVQAEWRDGQRQLRVTSPRFGEKRFRVTKLIGGRVREDFAGVELMDGGVASSEEVILPVTWVLGTQAWRYKGYSTMVKERPHLSIGPVWRQSCIFCHNTPPPLSVLLDDLHGPGAPTYQGSTGDATLPERMRLRYPVRDAAALQRALADERLLLEGTRPDTAAPLAAALEATIRSTEKHFDQAHLAELGIGCEACHGGSREHVEDPSALPSYLPRSPAFTVTTAAGAPLTRAEAINHVCARCHSVLFSRYPYTWEGGERADLEGGSHINSGEGRDFLLGHCSSQLTCTACHDPHREDTRAALEALSHPEGNRVCLPCHSALATPVTLAAHTHHLPGGEGSACVNCHMPRKNVGLDYGPTRYHRIGMPTEAARVERDRPLECALCHTAKSVTELVSTMEQWWGHHYDRAALKALYGEDLNANVLLATLARGKPHEQLATFAALGAHPVPGAIEALASQLWHPFPLVRFQARRALEQASGRKVELDLHLDPVQLQPLVRQWLEGGPGASTSAGP